MPFTAAGARCQIRCVRVNQMCSVNFNSQRSGSKAVDFKAKFGPQSWSTGWTRRLNSPLMGANAAQQISVEVKDQTWHPLIRHLKTQLTLMWLLPPMKNRAKMRGHCKPYPFSPAAWRPPWKWLQLPHPGHSRPLARVRLPEREQGWLRLGLELINPQRIILAVM